jgi:hypothetical protein
LYPPESSGRVERLLFSVNSESKQLVSVFPNLKLET